MTHGLQETLEQLQAESQEFRNQVAQFLDGLISHYVLDDGRLVVAHAGMREDLQGRSDTSRVRDFALYGETTGETDEYRAACALQLGRGVPRQGHRRLRAYACAGAGVVEQHNLPRYRLRLRRQAHGTTLPGARIGIGWRRPGVRRTREAARGAPTTAPERKEAGSCWTSMTLPAGVWYRRASGSNIAVREENAAAALEVMSRYAVDPRWLIYLPPTMSPLRDQPAAGVLVEHPAEAFNYFRRQGVDPCGLRRKAHGFPGGSGDLPKCGGGGPATFSYVRRPGGGGYTRARAGASFRAQGMEAAFLDRLGGRPGREPTSGSASGHRGSVSTAR